MNYHHEGLEYLIKYRDLFNSESYDYISDYIRPHTTEVSWTNCKDRDISLHYVIEEKLVFYMSAWLSSFVPTEIGSLSGVWSSTFVWDIKKSNVCMQTSYEQPTIKETISHIEKINFTLPITEEQYFQRSLVDDIPFTFHQIRVLMNFMELFLIHKDNDVLSWLRS